MGYKQRKGKHDDGDDDSYKKDEKPKMTSGQQLLPSMIKNKEKRSAVHAKLKEQKKLEKRKKVKARDDLERRALELGEEVRFFLLLCLCCHRYFQIISRI